MVVVFYKFITIIVDIILGCHRLLSFLTTFVNTYDLKNFNVVIKDILLTRGTLITLNTEYKHWSSLAPVTTF